MSEKEEEGTDRSWLKEHDSIQIELLKMKEEMVSEKVDVPDEDVEKEEESGKVPGSSEKEERIPQRKEPEPPKADVSAKIPKSEKSSKLDMKIPRVPQTEKQKNAPRLEEGKIPASPDLTNKIANVLQIENKLKRRKYEIEKQSKDRERPVKRVGVVDGTDQGKAKGSTEKSTPPSPPVFPDKKTDGSQQVVSQKSRNRNRSPVEVPNEQSPQSDSKDAADGSDKKVHAPRKVAIRRRRVRRVVKREDR